MFADYGLQQIPSLRARQVESQGARQRRRDIQYIAARQPGRWDVLSKGCTRGVQFRRSWPESVIPSGFFVPGEPCARAVTGGIAGGHAEGQKGPVERLGPIQVLARKHLADSPGAFGLEAGEGSGSQFDGLAVSGVPRQSAKDPPFP